jgi:dipeptidase E
MVRKILLTSAGFANDKIGRAFVGLLGKPASGARILFVPTAAICAESLRMVGKCIEELYSVGVTPDNVIVYNLDRFMSPSEIQDYDAVYFTGGNRKHLLDKVNEVDFGPVIKTFVADGGVFVGVSAGSVLATEIALVNCRITAVHCQDGSPNGPVDLKTCPDIRLTDDQGLIVDAGEASVIE